MTNSVVDQVVNRAKNLREFTVIVDMPDDFVFSGRIPYDMKIYDNKIEAKVWAVTQLEARERFHIYLNSCK